MVLVYSGCEPAEPESLIDDRSVRICNDLPLPENTRKVHSRQIVKQNLAVFTNRYETEQACLDVGDFYKSFLLQQGWKISGQSKKDSFSGLEIEIDFRKGNDSIGLTCDDTKPLFSSKKYAVSCSWGVM